MRKISLLLVLVLFLSGCAVALLGAGAGGVMVLSRKSVSQATEQNRKSLPKLNLGLSKEETLKIMGTKTVRAYQKGKAIDITNPYRTEILQGKDKTLEVVYYVTDVKKDDGAITDDELTPFVFDNGKLIGWGWSFLQENIQKYEIRWR